jgi:hypothetical protein
MVDTYASHPLTLTQGNVVEVCLHDRIYVSKDKSRRKHLELRSIVNHSVTCTFADWKKVIQDELVAPFRGLQTKEVVYSNAVTR